MEVVAVVLFILFWLLVISTSAGWLPVAVVALFGMMLTVYVRTSVALNPQNIAKNVTCTFEAGRIKITIPHKAAGSLWNFTLARLTGYPVIGVSSLVPTTVFFKSFEGQPWNELLTLLVGCFHFGVPVYLLERYIDVFVVEGLKLAQGQVKALETRTNEKVRLSDEYLQTVKAIGYLDEYWKTGFAGHYEKASRETIILNLTQIFATPHIVTGQLASIAFKAGLTARFMQHAKSNREGILAGCCDLRKKIMESGSLTWTVTLDEILGCLEVAQLRALIYSHDQEALDGYFSDMGTRLRDLDEAVEEGYRQARDGHERQKSAAGDVQEQAGQNNCDRDEPEFSFPPVTNLRDALDKLNLAGPVNFEIADNLVNRLRATYAPKSGKVTSRAAIRRLSECWQFISDLESEPVVYLESLPMPETVSDALSVLGLPLNVEFDEARRIKGTLVKAYHADTSGLASDEGMKRINVAFDLLKSSHFVS